MPNNIVTQNVLTDSNSTWFRNLVQPGGARPAVLPFSFVFNDMHSSEWLASCKFKRSSIRLDHNRKEHTLLYTDSATGLVLKCLAIEYLDFPTVEWTLYFKNSGSVDTPIIQNIQPLDISFTRKPNADYEYVLHHNNGTLVTTIDVPAGVRDYEPLTTVLSPKTTMAFIPPQGRPCAGDWPYFNLAWKGGGAIIVIGWAGAWAAHFDRDANNNLQVIAGQQKTHFILHPQEEVRTPRIVIQRYKSDWISAQNTWRKWMFAHNMPRPAGKLPEPMSGATSCFCTPGYYITYEGEILIIDRYQQEQLRPDCWWIDAGWYQMTDENGVSTYVNTGTWEVEKKRFPNGLRPVYNHAKSTGIGKGILWFEPERVTPKRWLSEQHPEWLLGNKGEHELLNLGNPEALKWAINMVDTTLNDAGITIYREDFNMGALNCWASNEPEDRQGINEIKHVTGHLEFWKELLRRNPNRMIDTCASGGHRLDIDTLQFSVPLWRSDYFWEPIGMQSQTYGLSMWIPYYGTGTSAEDSYTFRSDMAPFLLMSWDMKQKQLNYDRIRQLVAEWRDVSQYYRGDFYPLTDYSVAKDVWMAWQFHREGMNDGLVQVFRRAESVQTTTSLRLRGLHPHSVYNIRDTDTGKLVNMSGKELMDDGLPVSIADKPSALCFVYKELRTRS